MKLKYQDCESIGFADKYSKVAYVILSVFICLAILPHGVLPISILFSFLPIFYIKKIAIKKIDLFVLFLLWSITIAWPNQNKLMGTFTTTVMFFIFSSVKHRDDICISKSNVNVISTLFFASVVLQVAWSFFTGGVVDDEGGRRYSLLIGDPNFSGFLFFLGGSILFALNKKKTIVFLWFFCVYFFQSRALLFSGLIYFFCSLILKGRYLTARQFIGLQLFSFFAIFLFSVNSDQFFVVIDYIVSIIFDTNDNRLLNLNDRSNFGRFQAFDFSFQYIFVNFNQMLFDGLGSELALAKVHSVLPHNSMLYSIMINGVTYCLLTLAIFYRLIKVRMRDQVDIGLAMSFIFYMMFIHGGYTFIFMSLFLVAVLVHNGNDK